MSTREIQQLRKKFISAAMLSIFLAMLFIGTTVNTIAYVISRTAADRTLGELINGARKSEVEDYNYSLTLSQIFNPDYDRNMFLVLTFNEENDLVGLYSSVPENHIKTLIEGCSQELLHNNMKQGSYRGYYFKRTGTEDGQIIIAFLDAYIIISTHFRMASLTVLLCLLGMIITCFLVQHLSERAIQPEINNNFRQKQFITNASHELKTPLAVIRANTEMIEFSNGESEWTQSTIRQIDRLNGLIQNLVMITRSQEQENRNELSAVNISQIVDESITPYELLATQTERTIVRAIEPNITLQADESKLRELSTILIDNAIKYCDARGRIIISLCRQKNEKGVIFSVSNNYAAGESSDCSRFFDRFYRGDTSHSIDCGGYGIGLSIAESICRQYGGTIHAAWNSGMIEFTCCLK